MNVYITKIVIVNRLKDNVKMKKMYGFFQRLRNKGTLGSSSPNNNKKKGIYISLRWENPAKCNAQQHKQNSKSRIIADFAVCQNVNF